MNCSSPPPPPPVTPITTAAVTAMAPVVTHNLLRVAASKRPSAQYGKTGEGQSVGNGGEGGSFRKDQATYGGHHNDHQPVLSLSLPRVKASIHLSIATIITRSPAFLFIHPLPPHPPIHRRLFELPHRLRLRQAAPDVRFCFCGGSFMVTSTLNTHREVVCHPWSQARLTRIVKWCHSWSQAR